MKLSELPQQKNSNFITLSEASKLSGISRDYLNLLIRLKKLRAVKTGKIWFTTRAWIFEYQGARETQKIDSEKYLSLSRAEKIVGAAQGYLNVAIKRGKLRALKLGRNWFTTKEWLSEYQASVGKDSEIILKSEEIKYFPEIQNKKEAVERPIIIQTQEHQSSFKHILISGLFAWILISSLSIGLLNFSKTSNLSSFSKWLASGLNNYVSLFQSPATAPSKIVKLQEVFQFINTLSEAEALDAWQASEVAVSEPNNTTSVPADKFTLLNNRLSLVETNLKDQTDLINSELSLQKQTIIGTLAALFGIAKLVPEYPVSTIVVQGTPATLTSYSVAPQIQSGFDRLSASYLTLSNDAVVNGTLTVSSGANLNTLSVSGASILTGNTTIGGTLSVSGDTAVNNLTISGTLNAPTGLVTLSNASTTDFTVLNNEWVKNGYITNASTTNLTVSDNAWIDQLSVTGTATTTFNNPITSASGDFIVEANAANDVLLNPYGGRVGIGTISPATQLHVYNGTPNTFAVIRASAYSTAYYIEMGENATGVGSAYINSYQASSPVATLQLQVNSSTKLTLNHIGNVGIGTTTPAKKLTVLSDLSSDAAVAISGSGYYSYSGAFPRGTGLLGIANYNTNTVIPLGGYDITGVVGSAKSLTGQYPTTGVFGYATSTDGIVYGLRSYVGNAGGANGYGLYVQSVTGSVNNYGVYVADTAAKNYFGGNVGIASTSPSAVLSVNVSNAAGMVPALNINSATSSLLFVGSDGMVGIGTTNPGGPLDVFANGALADTIGGSITLDRYHLGTSWRGGSIFSYYSSVAGTDRIAFTVSSDTNPLDIAKIKMVLDGNGAVGIGTTTPSQKLVVSGPGARAYFQDTNAQAQIRIIPNSSLYVSLDGYNIAETTPIDLILQLNGGNVGIGKIPGAYQLDLSADTARKLTTTTWATGSDSRIKTNIQTISDALSIINQLRPVKFHYTSEFLAAHPSVKDTDYYNFIAQEYQQVFPDSVTKDATDGLFYLNSSNMIPYAIAGIKELASTTIALQNQLNSLIATSTLSATNGSFTLSTMNSDLNLNGFSILNVKSISGINGIWKIDEYGNITAQSVQTQSLTIGGGNASGVTVYARGTGQPKCIFVDENDNIRTSAGACGSTSLTAGGTTQNAGTIATFVPASDPIATTTAAMPTATTTLEVLTATTTPDIISATTTAPIMVSTTTIDTATTTQ